MRPERVDHVGKPIGQPAQARDEQPLHRADIGVEIEARDHRARVGIGIRRAVAEKFRQHMNVAGQQRRARRHRRRARRCRCSRNSMSSTPALLRRRARLGMGRMRAEQMIDRRARGRLAALVEPEARHHARIIGTPHAGHEARLLRRRHDAGRRSHDVGQPIADIDRSHRSAARPPIVPMPPACASISEAPTGVPATGRARPPPLPVRPRAEPRAGRRRSRCRSGHIRRLTKSPRPMRSK